MARPSESINGPATIAFAVTPHDTNLLAQHSRFLWIGGAGAVKVDLVDTGTAILFSGVPAGTMLWVRAKRVHATGTTATLIIAMA